jgi:hypothetical protein
MTESQIYISEILCGTLLDVLGNHASDIIMNVMQWFSNVLNDSVTTSSAGTQTWQ